MSYIPLDGKPFRLRPLDLAVWLERDESSEAQRRAKEVLLANRFEDVVAFEDDARSACEELLLEVERACGRRAEYLEEHPLVAASRLVADDLCVMEQRNGEWVLTAAVVCAPSRWVLAEKLGQSVSAIHEPVPGYATDLDQLVTKFFDRLSVEKPVWRLNWTVVDSPELFLWPRTSIPPRPRSWFFRVERQTLRRLARSDAIVFTIRTYVTSLDDLLVAHREYGANLLLALETAPEATLDYKGWRGVADELRERLNEVS